MPEPPPPPEYVSWNIFTWMVGGIGAILVGVIAWEVNTLLPRTEFEIWRASQETQISEIKDELQEMNDLIREDIKDCLLYTSPSPRDRQKSRMPSSA